MSANYVIEKRGKVNGLDVVVIFNALGFRCGYVGVDKTSPFYGHDNDSVVNDIDARFRDSEITYSNKLSFNPDLWYYGFDYGHSCYGFDEVSFYKYFPDATKPVSAEFMMGRPIQMDEVYDACVNLAKILSGGSTE